MNDQMTRPMPRLPGTPHERVCNIIYFGEPMLSLFRDINDELYLYYYRAKDHRMVRWLVVSVGRDDLSAYLRGKMTLRELLLARPAGWYVDLVHGEINMVWGVRAENVANLPNARSYYVETPDAETQQILKEYGYIGTV